MNKCKCGATIGLIWLEDLYQCSVCVAEIISRLRDENERLEKELKAKGKRVMAETYEHVMKERDSRGIEINRLCTENAELKKQAVRLREVLKKYSQHIPDCNKLALIRRVNEKDEEICDCGYDAALKEKP